MQLIKKFTKKWTAAFVCAALTAGLVVPVICQPQAVEANSSRADTAIVQKPRDLKTQEFLSIEQFAHRGLSLNSKTEPENTMPAFFEAVQHDFGIELDVQLSKDGTPVVFHDMTLDRLCHESGKITNLTDEQIEKLKVLDSSQHPPFLSDVLKMVDGKVPIMIELKVTRKQEDKLAKAVWEELKYYQGQYAVISFSDKALEWYKDNEPQVLRGLLVRNLQGNLLLQSKAAWRKKIESIKEEVDPDFISVKSSLVTDGGVWKEYKEIMGVPDAVWTITSEKKAQQVLKDNAAVVFDKYNPDKDKYKS